MGQVVPVSVRVNNESSSPNRSTTPNDAAGLAAGVGQELSQARRRRGKTLEDVSGDLKILPHYLTAIETGRFEDMPARVYAVGYVRSYAAYLGLDVSTILARFRAEMAAFDAAHAEVRATPELEETPVQRKERAVYRHAKQWLSALAPSQETALQAAGVMILVTAVSYSAYYVTASVPRSVPSPPAIALQMAEQAAPADEVVPQLAPPVSEGAVPQAQSTVSNDAAPAPPADPPVAVVDQPAVNPTAPVSPASTDIASLRPELAAPVPKKDVPLPSAKPMPPVSPASTDIASLQPELAPVTKEEAPPPVKQPAKQMASSQPDEGTVPGASAVKQAPSVLHAAMRLGQHYGMRNTNSRITLRLHGATGVRVGKNSQQIFIDRALGAGDTYRVPNLTGLKLSAEDAGAVEIILDDTTVGFAGKDGVPAREISLDPKAIAQLQQGG